jgi:hypothetical protein
MVRAEVLAKAWAGTLVLMALIVAIGIFAIPSGEEVAIQWSSWRDGQPTSHAPKWVALLALPTLTALMAWGSTARRSAEGGHDVWSKFAVIEFGVMGLMLVVHALIVLGASF